MNILVCIKQVPDMEGWFVPNDSGSWFEEGGHVWRMNEYDLCAVEEAVRLKDTLGGAARVTVLSIGPSRVVETIRKALAMGCDHGVHIDDSSAPERDSWQIAAMIAGFAADRGFDLVFTGMQSEDRSSAQVGVLVAERLGIASATGITSLVWHDDSVTVERELERGRRCQLRLKLPVLLTCQLGLNTPRYTTLPNIMKSKRAVLTVLRPEDSGIEAPRVSSSEFRPYERNAAGIVLEGDAGTVALQVLALLDERGIIPAQGGVR